MHGREVSLISWYICNDFVAVVHICASSANCCPGLCREDPSIFGYNLMNEPRSQAELYITQRKTTDGSKIYNISYNPADDLQSWIEDMAAYIKSIDPIHLLSTGIPPPPKGIQMRTYV